MFPLLMIGIFIAQTAWPDAGDWAIDRGDQRCATHLDFEGPGSTELTVSIERDGASMMLIDNANWSTEDVRHYPDVSVVLGDTEYSGAGATGYRSASYRRGLSMKMPEGFLQNFGQSTNLSVYNGDQLVDSLSLAGSAAAAAELRRCIAVVDREARAADRERERLAHIPTDPFAAVPSVNQTLGEGMSAVSAISWVSQPRPTYPDRALERGLSGSAELSCTVAANGSVSGCSIVSEIPAGAGFGRAALAAARSARVSPRSVDAHGVGSTVRFTQRFNLPPAEPVQPPAYE